MENQSETNSEETFEMNVQNISPRVSSLLFNDYLFSKKSQEKFLKIQENYAKITEKSKECYNTARANFHKAKSLIQKDSFYCLRKITSFFLAIFCFFYFLIYIVVAFIIERGFLSFSENFFNFFYNNIEINNPQSTALPS